MKKLLLLVATSALLCGSLWAQADSAQPPGAAPQAQSQSWSGTLADATCKEKDASGKCPVSSATTAYGIATSDGKFYKFDSNGNSQVAQEMQKSGSKAATATASVTGTLQGDIIQVQSLQMH